ncbi:cell division protein FtsQ/DivIB [Kumtagia ephedrae]|uniref:Cell division protein FtsQ n=1 Tax=Kumtagia ephedrae TaxID=2116701 RepID=A0A2P7SQZ4_9HYPH|nr:cell division protein FtsQ/DivIB [Mesorhizobium ephedrae]PSJ64888.1 cell division protein FtsQ [Mesorhizobium ephedrae]
MFALRAGQGRRAAGVPGASSQADRFVLPRWLRRPVRLFARLGTGDFVPPRFAATMATAALFAVTGVYGTYVGGRMLEVAQAVTARTGFAVDQVRVVGHRETSEIDILEKLDLTGWTSLIGFDVDDARDRVAALPWVEVASVRKVYPETLEIRITEREPFAIWQHDNQLSIIGRKGNVIVPFTGGRHADLPLVVGAGAAERAAAFVDEMAKYPDLAARVKGYILVAGRRWDLRLDNGMTVRLPEAGVDAAVAALLRMEREQSLFKRQLAAIDLRFSDRLVLQLTPEAAESRQADIANAGKKKSKPEKRI